MKTQIVRETQIKNGDILKVEGGYVEVRENDSGDKTIRAGILRKDGIFERVITQGPLVRLKRYLVG